MSSLRSNSAYTNTSASKSGIGVAKDEPLKPPTIDYIDMPKTLYDSAREACENAVRQLKKGEKKHYYKCAKIIKKTLEERHRGSYHVIMGKDFGSFFSYEAGNCVQFWINEYCFLIFKHG
ncbi:unnamed protein product [Blepharisma stoltei]|uniref:Dynein light chain n=1 Tax=Blepharisma stoltei TaxID=1481888 RepID=A0AAU9KAD7_9CILI|nr:unnamed protein product [Blepharisma stoltei]